jgi:hypothetical protein
LGVAVAKGIVPGDIYMRGVIGSLARKGFFFGFFPAILLMTLFKPMVFGLIITMSGCYFGLNATGGGEGVGRATTKAMVFSFVAILISDFFLVKTLMILFNLARYKAFRKHGDFGTVG